MWTCKMGKWVKWLGMGIVLVAIPSVAFADWVDVLRKFRPRISVQEDYTSNLDLTRDNTREDFITTVSPGLGFRATENRDARLGLDLDYALGLVSYAHNSQLNYVSHTGTLNTWYSFGNRWTLRLWDSYTRSQDPVEQYITVQPQPGVYYPGTQRERFTYERNIVQPSLTYQFGREDRFDLSYQNNYYNTQNPVGDDSLGHNVTPRLTYWFNIRHGITLEYAFQIVDYDFEPDLTEHRGRGRYTYRFSPQTSIFAEYIYDTIAFESPGVDFTVHNPSVGITYAFTPTLTGRLQAGYFWRKPEEGKTTEGPTVDAGITQHTQRLTLDLAVQGGYNYDLFGAETLGFYQYYRGIASIAYLMTQRFTASLMGSVERDDFVDINRKDWVWRAGPTLSYQPWRWLTASLGGTYGQRSSDQDINDYEEWRAFFRLTATYW
ncbi:MAG: outer membrane beta-barrel protein [Deltaproteobacteria bacterium]|nr:outer membrane beta-barrel protein [Deltaproteobacteria bacterium]